MGYITQYKLTVEYDEGVVPETTAKVILDYIGSDPQMKLIGLIPDPAPTEPAHYTGCWYDYERDVKSLARSFPGCTFTVHGKGEEADDEWETQFKGNSTRYRSTAVRWSDWRSRFEGKYDPACYTLYIDLPQNGKISDVCPRVTEWMRANSMDWAQTFDLDTGRSVKSFKSSGAVEWYGYAQMRDLAKAFPECTFELRCVPVRKGAEYIYRIHDEEEHFRQTELSWSDWSEWR